MWRGDVSGMMVVGVEGMNEVRGSVLCETWLWLICVCGTNL